jgi:hypothetical protein
VGALQSFQPFQRYLSAGERILWSGQPKQGIAFSRSDLLAIPFSLMWGGFAIFWNYEVWTSLPDKGTADDWFFKLWGLPFLAVGLYLIAGRFFYDAWVRNHSHYAVTNDRVLILRTSPTPKLISRDIQSLPMFELTEHRDGTGTIAFDSEGLGYSMFGQKRRFGMWAPAASANARFFGIDDPRRVYELIRRHAHS